MNDTPHGFRDKLIATEPLDNDLQQNYEKEMEKMFTEEITGVRRVGWWANYVVMLVFGCAMLANAFFNRPVALPMTGRWLWGLSAILVLAMSLLGIKLGWKKKIDLRKDSRFLARL